MTIDELPDYHPSQQGFLDGNVIGQSASNQGYAHWSPGYVDGSYHFPVASELGTRPTLSSPDVPVGVPDADDPIYGESAAINTLVPGFRGAHPLPPVGASTQSSDTADGDVIPPAGPAETRTERGDATTVPDSTTLDIAAPKERPTPSFTIDFLEDGDIESAQRVSQLINDPRNRRAFVSPYPTVDEDPECKHIFDEVKKPNQKIALMRDRDKNIIGTAELVAHPDRADMITLYRGVLDPELQNQRLGPTFIETLLDECFKPGIFKDADDNDRTFEVVEIHVILNKGNHPKDFSNVTRRQFSHAYRLMRNLSDFIDETAYYPPYIKEILDDGSVVYLPVAVFTSNRNNFEAYKKRRADGDID